MARPCGRSSRSAPQAEPGVQEASRDKLVSIATYRGPPRLIDLLSLVAGERTSGMARPGFAVMRDANPGR